MNPHFKTQVTTGDKIVETLSLTGATLKNNEVICCFQMVVRTAAQHCMEGGGRGGDGEFSFSPFEVGKNDKQN